MIKSWEEDGIRNLRWEGGQYVPRPKHYDPDDKLRNDTPIHTLPDGE